jgi:hypothetical protein
MFTNTYVRAKLVENEQIENGAIIKQLKEVAPSLDDEVLLQVYKASVSIRQRKVQKNGSFLENSIVTKMLDANNIQYKQQVTIDKYGTIIGFGEKKKKCYHIVDFVVGDKVDIGTSIADCIVLSCKTTCRERWTQDDWSYTLIPKLYILITLSDDYPNSKRFRENTNRKIVTCNPKKKDSRKFVLGFEDIIADLTKSLSDTC